MFSVYSKNKEIGLTVPILLEGSVYPIIKLVVTIFQSNIKGCYYKKQDFIEVSSLKKKLECSRLVTGTAYFWQYEGSA